MKPLLTKTLTNALLPLLVALSGPLAASELPRQRWLAEFHILGGNSEFSQAQIVLVGESHHSTNTLANAALLRLFAADGDVVLIEGTQALADARIPKSGEESFYDYFMANVPQAEKLTVLGWDRLDLYAKLQSKYAQKSKALKAENFRKVSEIDTQINALNQARDQSLIAALATLLKQIQPKQRIWVLGGRDHLVNPSVIDGLKNEKFLVLKTNENRRLTAENMSYLYDPRIDSFEEYLAQSSQPVTESKFKSFCETLLRFFR